MIASAVTLSTIGRGRPIGFVMFPAPVEQSQGARVVMVTDWFAELRKSAP